MQLSIFYNAVLLTCVNLLLRFFGTVFQIYLSSVLGAAGIGYLQLILSVGMLSSTVATAGIRTGAMYITAEELGRKKPENTPWILHGCFLYSMLISIPISCLLFYFTPHVTAEWIGTPSAADAVRLFSFFLPVNCLCGVMSGYFTAANRVSTLAGVEIAEQIFSMSCTVMFLKWAGADLSRACCGVILGSSAGTCLSLLILCILRYRDRQRISPGIRLKKRILNTAVPLALADDLKSGISTAETMIVPKRLARFPGVSDPVAVFGVISGMVFPVLMFPAGILFGLTELIIPEFARCRAAGSRTRIQYLAMRCLRLGLLYGAIWAGILYYSSHSLCSILYHNETAGRYLTHFALLTPLLYCDALTDAMTKGLGQQKICVRYNIITSSIDIFLLYLLLPVYGLNGYFFSFTLTHLLNYILSLRRLLKITGPVIRSADILKILTAMLLSLLLVSPVTTVFIKCACYCLVFFCILTLFHVISGEDFLWLKNLIRKR